MRNPKNPTRPVVMPGAGALVFGGLVMLALAPVAASAGSLMKVEYTRKAVTAMPLAAANDPFLPHSRWQDTALLDYGTDLAGDAALDPLGLVSFSLDGMVARPLGPQRWSLAGVLAYRYRHASLYGEPRGRGHDVRIGPSLTLSPNLSTDVYYRYSHDRYDTALLPTDSWLGDSDYSSIGVAQTWHFFQRRGMLRLGYEIGSSQGEDAWLNHESQRLNLSGRIPLFWGLRADVEADLSRNTYAGYGDATGMRREFRAGLSSAFGDSFEAAIQYRFADEEADVDALSRRHESWGLNLRYSY